MLYELQIYECVTPGRLPDLNKRFSTITLKILGNWHGIKHGLASGPP